MELSVGENVILACVVLTQYESMTDRWTCICIACCAGAL